MTAEDEVRNAQEKVWAIGVRTLTINSYPIPASFYVADGAKRER